MPGFINCKCVSSRVMFAPIVRWMLHAADLRTKKTRDGTRGRDGEESNTREQRNLAADLKQVSKLMVCLDSER